MEVWDEVYLGNDVIQQDQRNVAETGHCRVEG